jgi:hypothetical protein
LALKRRRRWLCPSPRAEPADPAVDEAWLRALPDEPLPGLDGLTPRQAAEREEYRERLEGFLRDIEYEAATAGRQTDFTQLREELSRGL